ncbi:hypothetical protein UFOVP129_84 [uncultured Caudovirales phage]|uniref:Uncharacterized protein n=1 Tax=uncultured Caudovirales phage TaxID=2100421 RepID=A0A6J5LD24_9CAUD|nr:hypothetical protein UFOVP129_84 [uncultured Caudovirales phage]
MNNNKLHYYLPHKVQMKQGEFFIGDLLQINSNGEYRVSCSDWWQNDNDKYPYKPILYPLSCLTETIIHNGKEEIPLVELANIEGTYKGEEYIFLEAQMNWDDKVELLDCHFFWYNDILKSFCRYISIHSVHCRNQLLLFDYCYSRRINIWGIDAIDPRTLEVNPYLITSKK